MSHVPHRNPNRNSAAETSQSRHRSGAVQTSKKTRVAAPPRPRMSLRSAMRQNGIDEHKIAHVLNEQVDTLRESDEPQQKKLLLDYLKECVKIMEPAARSNPAQDSGSVQLVHDIPRPIRECEPRDLGSRCPDAES